MKILILSTNTGGGHNAAGNAMIDALAELGVRAEMVDSLAIASEWGSKTVSGVYASVARHSPRACSLPRRSRTSSSAARSAR